VSRRYRVALIGDGVRQSFTPAMHEAEAAHLGLDYRYDVIDLLELGTTADGIADVLADAQAGGYDAVNVTHPVKQAVIPLLDELSEEAVTIGAVNLVLLRDGRRIGANTDASGFAAALAAGLPDAALDEVVQVGAGGAGSATAYSLLRAGAGRLTLVETREDAARGLADRYARLFPDRRIDAVSAADAEGALRAADGVLNATPLGMYIHPGTAFDVALLRDGAWVGDVVYRPVRTRLVTDAEARGLLTLDGGRMAVGQAVDSLRLITGLEPDADRMRAHLLELAVADRPTGPPPH
jgi:shikimate dehydrogenase